MGYVRHIREKGRGVRIKRFHKIQKIVYDEIRIKMTDTCKQEQTESKKKKNDERNEEIMNRRSEKVWEGEQGETQEGSREGKTRDKRSNRAQ